MHAHLEKSKDVQRYVIFSNSTNIAMTIMHNF